MLKTALTLLLLLLAPVAHAQVAGQQDAAYLAAKDAWLAGEDATALTQLSQLATSGNTAAQILLGRIAPRTHLHNHITGDMDRKARISLLRQPGGLSGKSWLKAAALAEPLAQAFLDANRLETQGAAALVLLDRKEPFAALLPAANLIRHAELDAVLAILDHPSTPQDYAAMPRYWHSGFDGVPDLPRPPLSERLLWNPSSPAELLQRPLVLIQTTAALSALPQAAPVRAFCAAHCPETATICAAAVWMATTSSSPFGLHSPSETLIAQSDYTTSPRFSADLKRLAQTNTVLAGPTTELDHCTATALGLQ